MFAAIASALGAVAAGVATAVLARLTSKYVRLTGELVKETRAARAPEVVADLQFDDAIPRFVIANRGPTAAYNVRIKVAEKNVAWEESKHVPKIEELAPVSKGVSYLPPGRTMSFLVPSIDWKKTVEADSALSFDVTYQDDRGQEIHREYSIEFAAIGAMLIEGRHQQPHQVIADAIRHAVDRIKPRSPFMPPRTRPCPVCFEKIRAEARKCPHCLEAVEPLPPEKTELPDSKQ
jgi:hypothetical protein